MRELIPFLSNREAGMTSAGKFMYMFFGKRVYIN